MNDIEYNKLILNYIGEHFRNNKTNHLYQVVHLAINATNANDGQVLIIYKSIDGSSDMYFARELNEFNNKFTLI